MYLLWFFYTFSSNTLFVQMQYKQCTETWKKNTTNRPLCVYFSLLRTYSFNFLMYHRKTCLQIFILVTYLSKVNFDETISINTTHALHIIAAQWCLQIIFVLFYLLLVFIYRAQCTWCNTNFFIDYYITYFFTVWMYEFKVISDS